KNSGCLLLVVYLAIVTGCSREDQRASTTGTSTTPESGGSKSSQRTGWTYQSAEHDFSLDLPSAVWKQMTKKRFIVDFWCPTRAGSPMLAGVPSVKKQTQEEFQESIPEFKANLEKDKDYLLKPKFQEGQTDSANPYVFAALCEKGTAGNQFIYVAMAAVWLSDKGITVATIFEGQGQMRSQVFKSIEYADFESEAKSICLSPK